MKVKITQKGVYDKDNERVEVGKVLTIKGDKIPTYLVGKCVEVESAPAKKAPAKKAVVNPAQKPSGDESGGSGGSSE